MVSIADQYRQAVSVVILNYNQPETTIRAVDFVEKSAGDYVREVLVVDNGSSPLAVETLSQALSGTARLITVGTNRYFGEGNNIGAEEATGEFLLLLNNDAFVASDCIEVLIRTLLEDSSIAAVGPMFLYPDGSVQEVGGIVLETGDVVQAGKGAIWGPNHYIDTCAVDYCSAACLMLRRQDFYAVGGFSLQWEPAYYEDVDLCLTLWDQIGRVVVNPRARVTHLESLTTGDAAMRLESQVEINRLAFVDKWAQWIRDKKGLLNAGSRRNAGWGDPDLGSGLPSAAPRSRAVSSAPARSTRGVRSAALFAPYELVPGGGERVLFQLAAVLSEDLGAENVYLSTPHRYSGIRLRQLSEAFGVPSVPVPLPADELSGNEVDVAFVLGNEIVPPYRAFGRHRNVYICQFPFEAPDEYVEQNSPLLDGFDEIWVYSEFVKRYVGGHLQLRGLPELPIRVVYPPAAVASPVELPPWEARETLITVGRFFKGGHDKRQDVAITIANELSSSLGRSIPLVVAGALHATPMSRDRFRELVAFAGEHDCRFYPNVSRRTLIELYCRSKILIHSAGFEVDKFAFPEKLEHFGIVPIEAASLGCIPVVYGEGGPAEVMRAIGSETTFQSMPEAIEKVGQLLCDPAGSALLAKDLIERVEMFSPTAFANRVREILSGGAE
jgi:GT2 family glycosyltransferase/glycosyltransferase involved in cell wall biosynthesis